MTDDLDGSAAVEEVSFSYRGSAYRIDVSRKNATAFDKALKPYIAAATKVPTRAATGRGRRTSLRAAATGDATTIRAWAAQHGHNVSTRGRIPKTIFDAYQAAKK